MASKNSDSKKNAIIGGLAAVAILVTGLGLWWYYYGPTPPPPPPGETALTEQEQKDMKAAEENRAKIVKKGVTGSS